MLPGKRVGVAIGLRDDGDEDEALEFVLQALIYMVGFQ
jgi:hypothetical protein